ncbi:MAG: tetratricopeptide repeat protein [Rhodanobacteraceae bacterium]
MRLNDRTRNWLPWLLLAIAVIATAAVYWPGLTGGWVFDDYPNIVDNAAIHITPGHSTLVAWVNAALSSPASFLHRPLASITFALNWYAGGGDPWPFKLTNVLIHLLNGVLLFCVLRELLRLRAWMRNAPTLDDPAATRLALVVTAGWLLLPINLMAVLYVVQRMESLCQVFVLGGLWAYLVGRRQMLTADTLAQEVRGFSLATLGIVLGTVLGLTSKETAVLLPVFAFLVEAIVLRFRQTDTDIRTALRTTSSSRATRSIPPALRADPLPAEGGNTHLPPPEGSNTLLPPSEGRAERSERARSARGDGSSGASGNRTDKRVWVLFTITLFIPAVLGFAWLLRGALRPSSWTGRSFTLGQRLLTEPRVLVDYLHWTLFPNPEVLSLYHDEVVKSTGLLTPWTTLGAMLLLAALIVVAVLLRNRRPLVSLGIGWFFAAQLLTATIVPLELVYEQRMYFASIGVLLAAGTLLLGLRKSIRLPLLRGFLVAVALLWFGSATYLRSVEWSNPLRLAVAEANRHPASPRATYEAGRLLLIASNYQPSPLLKEAWKYLRRAAAIPGSSALADQAMIMIADHHRQGDDTAYWHSMIHKLRSQPTRQEDISGLISLSNCHASGICIFDVSWLERAYQAALSRPHPIARLDGAYADFQRDQLHNDVLATKYLALAVAGDPHEPAYRVDLAALYAKQGKTERALEQIDELRRMNAFGRLDKQIAALERMAEQGKTSPTH